MYDMIIIGAGPAGISIAAEARTAGIAADKILILERGEAHSWSIRKFYPDKKLVAANYKGLPAICKGVMCIPDLSKDETISYLDRAIRDHELQVRYEEAVHEVSHQGDGSFLVGTAKGFYPGRVCVIAIGILGKPNKPDYRLPGRLKKAIHFDITSVPIRNSTVLVVGGGDSASEYVQFLVQCENRVTLSYRRASFDRMTSLNQEALLALGEQGQVRILRSTDIEGVVDRDGLPEVRFKGWDAAESFEHVVYALGGSTPANFLRQVGIDFDGDQPRVTEGYETNIPGLFLIGDLAPDTGSIIIAFNTSRTAMQRICEGYLECSKAPGPGTDEA